MKIISLVENTQGQAGCGVEHGLSLYIETEKHRLLVDTGASELLTENAAKKGVDLTRVDTVILSHGHYDHGGGIPAFAALNPEAKIYMQDKAGGAYYSVHGEKARYIGLPEGVTDLPQVQILHGDYRIDEELSLFTDIPYKVPMPETNRDLMLKEGETYKQDLFEHEQCLVISQGDCRVLLSGCAHHGILNILAHYRSLYKKDPDYVISGFHLMKKGDYDEEEIREIIRMACAMKRYRTTFYTGHCTGTKAYDIMKKVLGEKLHYLHCGDQVEIRPRKRRKSFMKWHKFFAWATVCCFLLTMITGYERK